MVSSTGLALLGLLCDKIEQGKRPACGQMAAAFAVELVRPADIAAVAWAAAQLQVRCGHWLATRIGRLEDFSNEESSCDTCDTCDTCDLGWTVTRTAMSHEKGAPLDAGSAVALGEALGAWGLCAKPSGPARGLGPALPWLEPAPGEERLPCPGTGEWRSCKMS